MDKVSYIKKFNVKFVALVSIAFCMGSAACIGYLNYAYHYNFVNSKSGDVLSLVDKFHQKECLSENNYNVFSDKWRHTDSETFAIDFFTCMEIKSRKLGAKIISVSIAHEQMVCLTKADKNDNKGEREKCVETANQKFERVRRDYTDSHNDKK